MYDVLYTYITQNQGSHLLREPAGIITVLLGQFYSRNADDEEERNRRTREHIERAMAAQYVDYALEASMELCKETKRDEDYIQLLSLQVEAFHSYEMRNMAIPIVATYTVIQSPVDPLLSFVVAMIMISGSDTTESGLAILDSLIQEAPNSELARKSAMVTVVYLAQHDRLRMAAAIQSYLTIPGLVDAQLAADLQPFMPIPL